MRSNYFFEVFSSSIFHCFLLFIFPRDFEYNNMILLIMFGVWLSDFVWTYLTQKYMKLHPSSSFHNFLWSFVPVAYIPIWVFFLWENFWLYDFAWVSIIITCLVFLTQFKEINIFSSVLFFAVFFRLLWIYLIGLYISVWWYFLHLLVFIYIFVLISYCVKYFMKQKNISSFDMIYCYDALFFTIGSIGSFFLYQLFQSYEVKIFLLATFLFNVILFKTFYQEEYFYKKLILSIFIILWLFLWIYNYLRLSYYILYS